MVEIAALAFVSVFIGGMTKGITGFGYAVTGTALLASFMPAKSAIILMLPALIATNTVIARQKGLKELLNRIKEFSFFAASLVVGSIAGTLMINLLPQTVIIKAVAVLILGYIAFKQEFIDIKFADQFRDFCLQKAHTYQEVLGFGSGVIFGAANVGVPIVAISDRIEDTHEEFMALLSGLMIIAISSRFVTSYSIGMYQMESIVLSLFLIVPGMTGLKLGKQTREHLEKNSIEKLVLILLTAISLKLLIS